jgi:hypothetical protein
MSDARRLIVRVLLLLGCFAIACGASASGDSGPPRARISCFPH